MATQIDQDATSILQALAVAPRNEYVEAPTLAAATGLTPDRTNDAVALLVDAGYAEWTEVMGTAPFDFGDAIITARGRREFQRLQALETAASSLGSDTSASSELPKSRKVGEPNSAPAESRTIRLFVSHSSADHDLARAVVELVRSALNLPAAAIRCTSVDGYRLPGGADTNAQLRHEVHDAEAFIGIVSPSSAQSSFVLFELGARWGANRQLVPLLAPGAPPSLLAGPLAGLNALRCDNAAQLHQLVAELGETLNLHLQRPDAYQVHIDRVIATPASSGTSTPGPISGPSISSLSLTLDERDEIAELSTEARELLTEAARDQNGSILVLRAQQGMAVSTNGREFSERGNPRSEARARSAINQLLEGRLVESQGDGTVLSVTDEGFRVADLLARIQ